MSAATTTAVALASGAWPERPAPQAQERIR